MNASRINAKDHIEDKMSVVDCAATIASEAARLLRGGANVVVSVEGVRGVSSSFFNVILSAVAEALKNDFSDGRFDVEVETPTQRLIYNRSLEAFSKVPRETHGGDPQSSQA